MFGILNVDKPLKYTSHDVVNKIRRILNIKQVGHTGTLDPMAVGVLPVCVGKATKIIQYLEDSKAYRAYIKLGVKTDTYDADGEIVEMNPVSFNQTEIEENLKKFQGEIVQTPPIYSAVHYKGKRLYEYARANVEVTDIPKRNVRINSIELIDVMDKDTDSPTIIVDIDCSTGTYVRSIANDLGENLGYGASLAYLIRTRAGKFKITEARTLEQIEEYYKQGKIDEIIVNPVDVIGLKSLEINSSEIEKISKGQYIKICYKHEANNIEKVQLIYDNKLIAIAKIEGNEAHPINVFVN